MRGLIGMFVGVVCGLFVSVVAWNPEFVYPFSQEWNEWEVVSDNVGPKYKTSLKWYPVVECTVVPRVVDGRSSMARIDIRWSGLSMLPLLTQSGVARLDYECVSHFKTAHLRK